MKDFLEWSPAPPVPSRRSVRRESRRRSLRLLKRQSIDTFPEAESVDVQEKLNALNSIENLPQKTENNSPGFSESAYGTVWIPFDSCGKAEERPSGKQRLSSTKCQVKSSCVDDSVRILSRSSEQHSDTVGEVFVHSGVPLSVPQSVEKPEASKRKSSCKKRRSLSLSVPPIQEFEAEYNTLQTNFDPPEEDISLDLVPIEDEPLVKSSQKYRAKSTIDIIDSFDQENTGDVPNVDLPYSYSSTQEEYPLDSFSSLPYPQSCAKPKSSRRKSYHKKRRSFVLSVPPIQDLKAEFDTDQKNGNSLEKNLALVTLDNETGDISCGNKQNLDNCFSKLSEKCEGPTARDTEATFDKGNPCDILSNVNQLYSSSREEDLLDLLAPLPTFSAKVKSLRRKSFYKKRTSFGPSVPPILELETELDPHQASCNEENIPEVFTSPDVPYLNGDQDDLLDSTAPLSAFLQSSLKSRALRRKSSYKKTLGFTPSVPSIDELEAELSSSEEKCDKVEKDFNTRRPPINEEVVEKEKFFYPIFENLDNHKSSGFLILGDGLHESHRGSFSSRVLTEKCADSSPETCRSSTPESQLRHMHRFLSPDKSLDCKSTACCGALLFDDTSPPDETSMDQLWVNATDLEQLLHCQTSERKTMEESPEENDMLALSAEQMEVSSPCSSQLDSNLSLDCVEMGVTSVADDTAVTDVTSCPGTSGEIGPDASDTGKDTIMDTGVNPGELPKTITDTQVNMDLHAGDSPSRECSPPAVILVMGSGDGDTFGLGNPVGCSEAPELYTNSCSGLPVEHSPVLTPLPDQSSPVTQLTVEPVLETKDSKSEQLKQPRRRKRLLERISQEGIILEEPQEAGQSRRSTRMRRKSVELFSNPQTQPKIQDPSSSGEFQEGANSDSPSEQTEPKKKKRKTKKAESIEDIYLNKNFKDVVEKAYETIYEDPERGISQRRQRRSIMFDTFVVHPGKVKRRAQKAAKLNGGAAARRKRAVSQAVFEKKMASLEEELAELDNT